MSSTVWMCAGLTERMPFATASTTGVVGPPAPGLKVVSVQPDDVSETLVSPARETVRRRDPSQRHCFVGREPASGLDRIQEDDQSRLRRKPDHRVGTFREVSRIRRGEISRFRERLDAVEGRPVIPATGVFHAEQIHPKSVESCGSAVRDVGGSVLHAQVADQRLWRVADDQEGHAALVDKVAPVARHLERVDESVPRRQPRRTSSVRGRRTSCHHVRCSMRRGYAAQSAEPRLPTPG